jgi:hypothetical protein
MDVSICPFDANIFPEEEFAAEETTYRSQITNYDRTGPSELSSDFRGNKTYISGPRGGLL